MPTAAQRLVSALFDDERGVGAFPEGDFSMIGDMQPAQGAQQPTPLMPQRPFGGQMFLTDEQQAAQQDWDARAAQMAPQAPQRQAPTARFPRPAEVGAMAREAAMDLGETRVGRAVETGMQEFGAGLQNLAGRVTGFPGGVAQDVRQLGEFAFGEGAPTWTEAGQRVRGPAQPAPAAPAAQPAAAAPSPRPSLTDVPATPTPLAAPEMEETIIGQAPPVQDQGIIGFTDPTGRDIIQRPGEDVRGAMERGETGLVGPQPGQPGMTTFAPGERGLMPGQQVTMPDQGVQREATRLQGLREAGPAVAAEREQAMDRERAAGEGFAQWGGLTGPGGMDERRERGAAQTQRPSPTQEDWDLARARGRAGVTEARAVAADRARQERAGEREFEQRRQLQRERIEAMRDEQAADFVPTGHTVTVGDREYDVITTSRGGAQILPRDGEPQDRAQVATMKYRQDQLNLMTEALEQGDDRTAMVIATSLGMENVDIPYLRQTFMPEEDRVGQVELTE